MLSFAYFLFVGTLLTKERNVEVHYSLLSPRIDGFIENIWQQADSAYGFIQYFPYEGQNASEPTVVYLLQDAYNLYIAFRCYFKSKPLVTFVGNTDCILLYLDSFGSKTIAYYFKVTVSGVYSDGMLLDDGRSSDDSWDGVWYSAVKCYDDRYEIEIKIPYKSIHYKKNLNEWGINFKRVIASKQEYDCWTEVAEKEGFRISNFGILKGVNPQSTGYYFEVYPEGFIRYEKYAGATKKIKPSGSLNVKWDITSQATLASTIYPDFAQIEADPYTLNLSRYPIRLSERRPFFVEGSEVFRASGQDIATPIEIFYSKKIGRAVNGRPVPILGGVKIINKSSDWNIGLLGAMTDSLKTEPKKNFTALRIRRKVLRISDIGVLFSGAMVARDDYNYALGLDAIHRFELNQLSIKGAISDYNKKRGWAVSSGGEFTLGTVVASSSYEIYSDSFDVSEVGFAPWAGKKQFLFACGPKYYLNGFVRTFYVGSSLVLRKEQGEKIWSKSVVLTVCPNFRNNWGFFVDASIGRSYETGLDYTLWGFTLQIWGRDSEYTLDFCGAYYYSYNWLRNYLAYQGTIWLSFECYPITHIRPSCDVNFWVEWDTLNAIVSTTSTATPRIEFQVTKDINIGIFNEFVFTTPGTDFGKTDFLTNRFGFLFSYNFKPKSWLYIALNDYRTDQNGNLRLQNQVGAIKAKYLLYF